MLILLELITISLSGDIPATAGVCTDNNYQFQPSPNFFLCFDCGGV